MKKQSKKDKITQKEKKERPLQISIIGWFGIALSLTYLIWGSVNIILSIMDRTFGTTAQDFIILAYGLPILAISVAFFNMKKWGWYGLSAVLLFVVVWTVMTLDSIYGIIWGVLALAALIAIFTSSVRKHYFPG
jgi:hypothetical protein